MLLVYAARPPHWTGKYMGLVAPPRRNYGLRTEVQLSLVCVTVSVLSPDYGLQGQVYGADREDQWPVREHQNSP